ncbi:hypothetical protein LEP1GSC008_2213 [Leptospira kirschneri serovar Bulgarica str. Nikolaevo]|uniref:Uncharacterized protein n=1 Tax=Leptospira kirschneri serovar Bulgarica str. Nikolaevo TaxID=1240687 RepID=M6F818_9LEPT|nr:hypothetical protein LEP1GSC008_2213 [Leptospira kirschneri serovar Bulgarica str. Nikolaevo]
MSLDRFLKSCYRSNQFYNLIAELGIWIFSFLFFRNFN